MTDIVVIKKTKSSGSYLIGYTDGTTQTYIAFKGSPQDLSIAVQAIIDSGPSPLVSFLKTQDNSYFLLQSGDKVLLQS